ncbi:bifunctional N-acetylglucosamine-1-phosphate uridyltransferase/glucosamine-1-phosphate acetyltransferase [Schaalia sp. Marseille-Q2122]|uniref:bifunctional UDP-N-acetylglucosamine diphosphorylase/glucosamine-1-phosphate N-acetyltransferase GlmU n=1 Tax=Schaalia sp. Marseille-Q2122 TaxID=2736604 RepID=UPI00158E4D4C|nr:NTP transferase domain-containing protein [Schaalia sp. Marseille-Q2122]
MSRQDVSRPTAVIVLAAGQGTRMKSELSKVVHPLAGLSMIGHALRTAQALTPEYVVAVVRHQREQVMNEALRVLPNAIIADQDEIPGTGRAVLCGLAELRERAGELSGTVLVTSGDVPLLSSDTLAELVRAHAEAGHAVSLVSTIVDDPTGYGRIIRDEAGNVVAIVEQRDATPEQAAVREINAGIYAFDAAFLYETLQGVGTNNAQGEVYLTDVVAAASPAGRTAGALVLEDEWQARGCNDRAQLAELGAELNRRICLAHMRQGVSIVDPTSTWIDVDVTIGPDTTIWPGTILRGNTHIEGGSELGPHTTLTNVTVGARSVLPSLWGSNVSLPADTIGTPHSILD